MKKFFLRLFLASGLLALQVPDSIFAAQAPAQCTICQDDIEDRCNLSCGHAYCKGCLGSFLDDVIKNTKVNGVCCPDCKRKIENLDLGNITNDRVKLHKIDTLFKLALPGARQCPTRDCYSALVPNQPVCQSCGVHCCLNCNPAHPSALSCMSVRENTLQAPQWIFENTKPCPRCAMPAAKDNACKHVTCGNPVCRVQFCWACLYVPNFGWRDNHACAWNGLYAPFFISEHDLRVREWNFIASNRRAQEIPLINVQEWRSRGNLTLQSKAITAIVVTAVAAAIIESATRYMYPPAIVAAEPSQGWMSWFTSWFVAQEQKQINVSEYMSVSAQLAQKLTNIVTITKETKSQNGIFKPLLLQGKVGAGQKACAYMLAQRCAMQPAVIPSNKIMQALTNGTILQEITQLFEWAERQVNGVVIYFESVELLLAERPGMSVEAKQARTLILSKLHAKNILIMGSTNQPQALGVALLHGFHTINFAAK